MSELVLGTVQFGLNYGVTNQHGEISDNEMASMLELASTSGIRLFDTAADYGTSQQRLGTFRELAQEREFVTKFSLPPDGSSPTPENIYLNSMKELNVQSLYAVLFHKLEDLSDPRCSQAVEILRQARDTGLLGKVGVSIYNSQDLVSALRVIPDLDIIQLPANILDLDLLNSTEIKELHNQGVEIHVRSVFLQGLLLTRPEDLPAFFEPLKPAIRKLNEVSSGTGKSVLELVLGKIRSHPYVDAVLVGATSLMELEEIASAWNSSEFIESYELPVVPQEILDPRKWPQIRI